MMDTPVHSKLDLILGFLKQHEKRFDQIDRRFDQVDKRFEQIETQLDDIREEVREVKREVRADRQKLDQVYESRNRVKIDFGWQWGMVSLFIATIASGITKIFSL